MGYRFTEDDKGKDVLTMRGTRVGRISDVSDERVTVDRNPRINLDEDVLEFLGWEDGEEAHISSDQLNQVREDRVKLIQP